MALELVAAPDLDKLEAGEDDEFFLAAAEQAVRDYCHWHIAPERTVTNGRFRAGQRGLLILPTMHLTQVAKVEVDGRMLVEHEDYEWEACGVIHRRTPSWPVDPWVTVTFTHGYNPAPPSVSMVVLELASLAKEMPTSAAKDVYAGPFRMSLSGQLSTAMSKDQKNRLDTYVHHGFGF